MHHLLLALRKKGIGWANQIQQTLQDFKITDEWETIKKIPEREWKKKVYSAAEKKNKEIMMEECFKSENGRRMEKTKTKTIIKHLEEKTYDHKKESEIMSLTKNEYKVIVLARYGMLRCGRNYKCHFGSQQCQTCGLVDDEDHKINHCIEFRTVNLYDCDEKVDFKNVYSKEVDVLKKKTKIISKTWDL
jgi:hypothetical protein